MNDTQRNIFLLTLIYHYITVSSFFTQSLNYRYGSLELFSSYVNNRNRRRTNTCPTESDQRLMNRLGTNNRRRDDFDTNRIKVDVPSNHRRRMVDPPHTHRSRRVDHRQRRDDHYRQRTEQHYNNQRRDQPTTPSNNSNRRIMNPSTSSKEELMQFYDLKQIILRTNPYEILQVTSNDKDELKQAYRRLAFKFHPDVVIGENNKLIANEAFAKINEAYNTLLNGRARNGNNNENENSETPKEHSETPPTPRTAAMGQQEEDYFYPRGEPWYKQYKERERAVYTDFDPAMYEENDDSVGSIFTEVTEYINEDY